MTQQKPLLLSDDDFLSLVREESDAAVGFDNDAELADNREKALLAYKGDPISRGPPWTIGYGHTGPEVHRGLTWTLEQAEGALLLDIANHNDQLAAALPWVASLDPARRRVLQNMAFNLGVGVAGGTRGQHALPRAAADRLG